ncbi:FGGY-family carbohydrate kinase [Phycisphaeraceae bacterium D3-23]
MLTGNELLAIDAGTQGVSLILWCPASRTLQGVGEQPYEHDFAPGLPDGRLEHFAHYWSDAIKRAMTKLRDDVRERGLGDIEHVAGIGVTGHMHCMVRKDAVGNKPFGCDLWNDPRGVAQSEQLTQALGEHMPARWTGCHVLARMQDDPEEWRKAAGVTVTSGSIVHDLTGQWALGPGDASGMFGKLDAQGQIDRDKLRKIDALAGNRFTPLEQLVPRIVPAGEVAGTLSEAGSALLGGLPVGTPVAAPEGDQQSVLVVAAVDEMELALSAGTSFTGNLPATGGYTAQDESVNVLATPDRLTMFMVCVRNGTIGFAQYVSGLAELSGRPFGQVADDLTDLAQTLKPEPDGAMLWPFFQGENVAKLPDARASLEEASIDLLSTPGVMARLLLEAPTLTLRYGLEQLKPHTGPVKRVLLTGGALKSKDGFAPQLYADILGVPVAARAGDEEGTAKGAALLAGYMVQQQAGNTALTLAQYAKSQTTGDELCWRPDPAVRAVYDRRYARFAQRVEAWQGGA